MKLSHDEKHILTDFLVLSLLRSLSGNFFLRFVALPAIFINLPYDARARARPFTHSRLLFFSFIFLLEPGQFLASRFALLSLSLLLLALFLPDGLLIDVRFREYVFAFNLHSAGYARTEEERRLD